MISVLRSHESHRLMRPGAEASDAMLVGVFAAAMCVVAAGIPSFWADEAATVSASTRTLPQLRDLLSSVDAVHGVYYLVMHAWFTVFPATEFWARVPSSLFVGFAGAGVVTLGHQLSTRKVAVTAGVVFAVLPRTTWAGIEARSAAMSIAAAVWVTVLCVAATRRNGARWWIGYGSSLVMATLVTPFLVLLIPAHWLLMTQLADCRRTRNHWWLTAVTAGAALAPFLAFVRTQKSQVDWIQPVGSATVVQVVGDQNFPPVFASSHRLSDPTQTQVTPDILHAMVFAWALVSPVVVVVAVLAYLAIKRRRAAVPLVGPNSRLLILLATAWMMVPTAVVVAYSVVGEPLYQPRYLSFTAPAMALLISLAVVTVGRSPLSIALLSAVLLLAAMPNYVAQRLPYAKLGNDYSQVADLLASHARAGDCLYADDAVSQRVGWLKVARPAAFRVLRDDGEVRSAVDGAALTGPRRGLDAWAARLSTCPAVWTIADADAALPALSGSDILRNNGFRVIEQWRFNITQVVESRR